MEANYDYRAHYSTPLDPVLIESSLHTHMLLL